MSCRMGTQIQMVAHEDIDESFLTQVRTWVNEVLEIEEIPSSPPYLSVSIWNRECQMVRLRLSALGK